MVFEILQKCKDSDFISLLQIHDILCSGAWKEITVLTLAQYDMDVPSC